MDACRFQQLRSCRRLAATSEACTKRWMTWARGYRTCSPRRTLAARRPRSLGVCSCDTRLVVLHDLHKTKDGTHTCLSSVLIKSSRSNRKFYVGVSHLPSLQAAHQYQCSFRNVWFTEPCIANRSLLASTNRVPFFFLRFSLKFLRFNLRHYINWFNAFVDAFRWEDQIDVKDPTS